MVLGDADGMAEPDRVETEQSARCHRDAERPPGRRGVVLGLALVQEDARAHGDLVADEHGLDELRGRRAPALGDGQRRGDDHGAWVPLGDAVSVVVVEDVREDAVRPGRAGNGQPPAVEERGGGVTAICLARVVGRDQRGGRRPAGLDDSRAVEQQQRDVALNRRRHVVPAQAAWRTPSPDRRR